MLIGVVLIFGRRVLLTQVVEDGYEFFAKRQLVTLFSAPNYCGEFDNAGAMMSVDDTLMCSFQVCAAVGVAAVCASRCGLGGVPVRSAGCWDVA